MEGEHSFYLQEVVLTLWSPRKERAFPLGGP